MHVCDVLSGEDVLAGERSFIHFEVLPLVEFQVLCGGCAHAAYVDIEI